MVQHELIPGRAVASAGNYSLNFAHTKTKPRFSYSFENQFGGSLSFEMQNRGTLHHSLKQTSSHRRPHHAQFETWRHGVARNRNVHQARSGSAHGRDDFERTAGDQGDGQGGGSECICDCHAGTGSVGAGFSAMRGMSSPSTPIHGLGFWSTQTQNPDTQARFEVVALGVGTVAVALLLKKISPKSATGVPWRPTLRGQAATKKKWSPTVDVDCG